MPGKGSPGRGFLERLLQPESLAPAARFPVLDERELLIQRSSPRTHASASSPAPHIRATAIESAAVPPRSARGEELERRGGVQRGREQDKGAP